jgi:hypothetical protein
MNKVKKLGLTKDQARDEAIHNYIEKYLDTFPFKPIDITAFGGIVHRGGGEKSDSWSRSDIESWAVRLGKLLKKDGDKDIKENI